MRTNERTTERTNQQTNEYDGSHYLLAEVIKGAFLMNLCIVFIWATRAHIGVGDGGRVISSPQNRQKIFSGKYRVKSVHFVTFFTYIYSASQKISPEVFWHFPPYTCSWEFFDQNLHACYRFQSTLEHTFLFNYLQLWRIYAISSVTTQFISCAQNVHHRPKRTLAISDIFPKQLGIFNPNFTCLLYVRIYTRIQIIFIQLSPTVTKLCHIKCDHPACVSADSGHFEHMMVVALNMA